MTIPGNNHYLALSGGVGGAKLVLGLSRLLAPDQLTIIANTGDDFEHLGLNICPDIDTLLYTLAEWNNRELGWGQQGETWNFLAALKRLGGESWFNLGDRDLATHIMRTERLNSGESLSQVVAFLGERMGIRHPVLPMTDHRVRTLVHTRNDGTLAFQHYFVRDRCQPEVTGFEFSGIEQALPAPGFLAALDAELNAVLICPSNPFVSVDPILGLPGVVDRIRERGLPVLVVSNIVGGMAIKGPAAKMMTELGMPRTAVGVAQHYVDRYGDLVSGFVLDESDRELAAEVESLGLATIVAPTVMVSLQDKTELAARVLGFAAALNSR